MSTIEDTVTGVPPLDSDDGCRTFSERMFRVLASADEHVEFWASADERTRLPYAELSRDARRTAVELRAAGFTPGDVAVLAFEPGIDFLRGLLGALHAGLVVAPVPLPTRGQPHAMHRLEAIAADAGSRLVLCDSAGAAVAAASAGEEVDVVVLPALDAGRRGGDGPSAAAAWEPPEVTPEDLVILQYTSGSTGSPKGVEISQANLLANQRSIAAALDSRPGMVIAGWLPHYHDMGLVGQILHPFAVAGSLAFTTPSQFLRRPVTWPRLLSESRATCAVAPDFAYALCAKLLRPGQVAGLDLSSLRTAVTGAEPVREDTLVAFTELMAGTGFVRQMFRPAYGLAETTLLVSGREPEGRYRVLHADPDALAGNRLVTVPEPAGVDVVSCGTVAEGTDVRIVAPEETPREVTDGVVGEIWVRGATVARGYRGRPATAEDFAAWLGDEGPFYRTGDLGALVDGRLYVTGRIKELIIVRGRNVYPADVEHVAATAAGEAGTGVAAAFEAADGRVTVVVELMPWAAARTPDGLRAGIHRAVTDALGTGSVTVRLTRRGAVPRTTSGKVQRRRVRAMVEDGGMPLVVPPEERGDAS
ncbi:fatty acyl-AMP ligase [Myceligenerans halotolerans]